MRTMVLAASLAVLSLAACGDKAPAAAPAPGQPVKSVQRALAAADVEKFLEVFPDYQAHSHDLAALQRVYDAHRVDVLDWSMLQARILVTYGALSMANTREHPAIPEESKADADVVRP